MQPIIVGIGEVLWDILPQGKQIGGAPANFAYHVSQFGLNSCVASAVGDDPLGEEIATFFGEKRLAAHIPVVSYPTGTVQVEVDAQGVPRYHIKENVAWDNIPFGQELAALARRTQAVCFGSLAQRSAVSRSTIRSFLQAMPADDSVLKVFDINLRQNFYSTATIEESLGQCNVLKINDEELSTLCRLYGHAEADPQQECRRLLEVHSLKMLILTCSVNGSYVFTRDGGLSFRPTPKVAVADTVGAGDSFTAAFIASVIRGLPVAQAHERAAQVSAYVCTQKGAMPQLPASLVG